MRQAVSLPGRLSFVLCIRSMSQDEDPPTPLRNSGTCRIGKVWSRKPSVEHVYDLVVAGSAQHVARERARTGQ